MHIILIRNLVIAFLLLCIVINVYLYKRFSILNKASSLSHTNKSSLKKTLAIFVPYRERFEELLQFVPHISRFLSAQNLDFDVYILNQVDQYRFNRAMLINVAFASEKAHVRPFDCFCIHDVDLLPLFAQLSYACPSSEREVVHISSPELHPLYHYPTFIGGILILTNQQFQRVNGMSNRYWGWGREDDEFYVRLVERGVGVSRPVLTKPRSTPAFKHLHASNRKRDYIKTFNQDLVTKKRDYLTGLSSLSENISHVIQDVYNVSIQGCAATLINVRLACNLQVTPWCQQATNKQKLQWMDKLKFHARTSNKRL